MTRLAIAAVLVVLCGWRRRRRHTRIREEFEAETVRTVEDVARRWGM